MAALQLEAQSETCHLIRRCLKLLHAVSLTLFAAKLRLRPNAARMTNDDHCSVGILTA